MGKASKYRDFQIMDLNPRQPEFALLFFEKRHLHRANSEHTFSAHLLDVRILVSSWLLAYPRNV